MRQEICRLDSALVQRSLVRSRNQAARLIAAGRVRVNGVTVHKASTAVVAEAELRIDGDDHYVSRAAGKLIAALDAFSGLKVAGCLALDAGASTGGFTQVLLERGVRKVLAVDVGHHQLSPLVAADARVASVEGYNIRYATSESLAAVSGLSERPQLVVADLSFISLLTVLPALVAVARADADFILLVKPQFEVGRTAIREGVVTDPVLRLDAVCSVLWAGHDAGLKTAGFLPSPVVGNGGNQEYLLWLSTTEGSNPTEWLERVGVAAGA